MRIRMSGIPGGARCTIGLGPVTVGVSARDALDALHAASGIAVDLASTMAAHPELAPLMGPLAAPLMAINVASKAAKSGDLNSISRAMPVAANVVSALLRNLL